MIQLSGGSGQHVLNMEAIREDIDSEGHLSPPDFGGNRGTSTTNGDYEEEARTYETPKASRKVAKP